MLDSFVFYKSFYDAIKTMPDEVEQAKAYKYIFEYVFEGKEPNERDFATAMFCMVKVNIDNAKKKYIASVENGKKGGRPKKNENLEKPKNNLDKTYKEPKQNLNVNDNVNVNDNDNVNVNNIIADAPTIFHFLESNFARTISPIEIEKLKGWQENFNDDILKYGIELCCNANAKTFNYLNAILNNWKSKGFTKLEECKNENLERNTKTNKPIRQEIIPDWFNKETKTKKATKEEVEEMQNLLSEYQDP